MVTGQHLFGGRLWVFKSVRRFQGFCLLVAMIELFWMGDVPWEWETAPLKNAAMMIVTTSNI